MTLPEASGRGRGDGDTTFLFLDHPVHGGLAFVNLADLVGTAGVEEDTVSSSRLTGVDVGHDTDITGVWEVVGCGFFDF